MKKRLQGFIAGVLITSVLMFSITGFAENVTKGIEVTFNSIHLKVNGNPVEANNILYDGTTYAPIRAVAEMLGKNINWDEGTNTVNIVDPDAGKDVNQTVNEDDYKGWLTRYIGFSYPDASTSIRIINGYILDIDDYPSKEQMEVLKNMYPGRYIEDGTFDKLKGYHELTTKEFQKLKNVPEKYKDVYDDIIKLNEIVNNLYYYAVQPDPGKINYNMPKIQFSTEFGKMKQNYISICNKIAQLHPEIFNPTKGVMPIEFGMHFPMTESEKKK